MIRYATRSYHNNAQNHKNITLILRTSQDNHQQINIITIQSDDIFENIIWQSFENQKINRKSQEYSENNKNIFIKCSNIFSKWTNEKKVKIKATQVCFDIFV